MIYESCQNWSWLSEEELTTLCLRKSSKPDDSITKVSVDALPKGRENCKITVKFGHRHKVKVFK